jgi:hypothetical protein
VSGAQVNAAHGVVLPVSLPMFALDFVSMLESTALRLMEVNQADDEFFDLHETEMLVGGESMCVEAPAVADRTK